MCRDSSAITWREEPILEQRRDLSSAASRRRCRYVLANLDKLVVKAVGESGGYGMLVGPACERKAEREAFAREDQGRSRELHRPADDPAFDRAVLRRRRDRAAPCRSAALHPARAQRPTIVPGALTRVALKRGSLVVNSSQGGGSKDTWVLRMSSVEDRHAEPGRGQPLLDEPLSGAGRAHARAASAVKLEAMLEQTPKDAAKRSIRVVVRAASARAEGAPESADRFAAAQLTLDRRQSLLRSSSVIRFARDNARQVREQISTEMWEQLTGYICSLRALDVEQRVGQSSRCAFLPRRQRPAAVSGVTDSTMRHGEGWHFIRLGRYHRARAAR